MRTAFIKTLIECARRDEQIILMTGDLGFMALEDFQREFGNRFINAGVAEQNMVGMAAGIAMSGKKVFVYSIIPFVTMRCLEQIRNDICYHNLDVKIVGVGTGYSYSNQGATHHAVEDIGVLRSLPNLKIISPGDPIEVEGATKAMVADSGPIYMRLGKRGEPVFHSPAVAEHFSIGKAIPIMNGSDATVITTGSILINAVAACRELEKQGMSIALLSMPTIKPIDKEAIERAARNTKAIVTVEEHNYIGGLGSAIAEVLAEIPYQTRFRRLGIKDFFVHRIGSHDYLREKAGLSAESIERAVKELLEVH